ncbi:DEAD/DEAH box helicase, partial [Kitasatospora phosalacinea]
AGRGRARPASRTGPPTAAGRWSLLPAFGGEATARAAARAQALLDRHGVLTRGAVAAERLPGGFAGVYRVLSAFEERGRARRGYFVEGLGGAQFAMDGAADRLRSVHSRLERATGDAWAAEAAAQPPQALVLAAADPANAYGAALAWPEPPADTAAAHRPGRKAGSLVALVDGELVLYLERGGRSLLAWDAGGPALAAALAALAGPLTVERVNGHPALTSPLGPQLETAGFHPTPKGYRLR